VGPYCDADQSVVEAPRKRIIAWSPAPWFAPRAAGRTTGGARGLCRPHPRSARLGTRAAIVCSPSTNTRSVGTSIIIRIICELAQRIRALADKLLEMKVRTTFVERIDSAEPPSPYRPTTARSSLEVRPATARCLRGRQRWHARLKVWMTSTTALSACRTADVSELAA